MEMPSQLLDKLSDMFLFLPPPFMTEFSTDIRHLAKPNMGKEYLPEI